MHVISHARNDLLRFWLSTFFSVSRNLDNGKLTDQVVCLSNFIQSKYHVQEITDWTIVSTQNKNKARTLEKSVA